MTINEYVKKWCDEEYDVRKEDFYADNANYVIGREWAIGGFKHGIFSTLLAVITVVLFYRTGKVDFVMSLMYGFTVAGIFTVCFWLYGIREYDANSIETSHGVYGITLVFLIITNFLVNDAVRICFSIPSAFLYVFLTFVNPIRFIRIAMKMKERIEEEMEEEENAAKDSYARWENGYKAFRYGLPEAEVPKSDPAMDEARTLFADYANNQQMLKTRYRQLAKQYHPDKGGDTHLFQCIIEVYEELNKKFI